jgi:hypothetical protein
MKNGSFNFGSVDAGVYCIFLDSQDVIIEPKELFVSIDFDSGISFSLNSPSTSKDAVKLVDGILFEAVGFSVYGYVDLDTFHGDTSLFTYALFKSGASVDDINNAVQVVVPVKREDYGLIMFRNVSSGGYVVSAFSKGMREEVTQNTKIFNVPVSESSSTAGGLQKLALSPALHPFTVPRHSVFLTPSGTENTTHRLFTITTRWYRTVVRDTVGALLAGAALTTSGAEREARRVLGVSGRDGVLLYACHAGETMGNARVEKDGFLFEKFDS